MQTDTEFHRSVDRFGRVAVAHRGSRLLWPENTLLAFRNAAGLGYRFFETDLRTTLDGTLICFHDPMLDRTTDGHGLVRSAQFDELSQLDAGYRHRLGGGFPFRGTGIRVSTFAELVERFPDSGWILDLKADGTEEPLARLVDEMDLYQRVMVGSFSAERLSRFRHLTGGKVATSTSTGEIWRALAFAALGTRSDPFHPATSALAVPANWFGVPVVNPGVVELAHRHRRMVYVWTVNDPAEMKGLTDMGVDGIMTDRPDLLGPENLRTQGSN
ncbi:MAG: glycerophosphodiester phosphodiesterase [Actinomycetota bacterium]